jgi:trk system potassium uptake protein TrkA
MEHSAISFIPLLIVIGLAFLVPLLLSRFKRVGIPIVVGEIIAGIIVGKSGLNLVQEGTVLRILSDLGFAYLMFLSGLEINFATVLKNDTGKNSSKLQGTLSNPLVMGILMFTLTLAGSAGAGFFMRGRELIRDPWLMGLILSTTSLGVVVPVLKERELARSRFGQNILVAALIADFASIFLISVYVLLRSQGLTLEILLVLVLFAAFVAIYRIAALFREHLPAERIMDELSSATSQIKLRGSFVLALVFIALAESLGIEIILGAFLAGVIVSMLSKGEGTILQEKLDAIGYGFFIPIFFIMVGVSFDLPALLSSSRALFLVPLLIGIAYVVKLIPALLYGLQYSWRETLAAGTLLSARLSLIIAAAAIGLRLGVISDAVNSTITLVAVITCTLSPIFFNRLVPKPDKNHNRVIVIGSRTSAGLLVSRLREHNLEVVLISSGGDATHTQQTLVTGDPSPWSQQALLDELRRANIDKAATLIAMEEKDEDNLRICRIGRHYEIQNIIAWVQDPLQNDRYRQVGAQVINPAYSTLLIMESMVLNPHAFSITPDVDEVQEIREIKLQNRHLVGRRVNDLTLPRGITVLMIERSNEILVPDRETVLRANDTITLVGADKEIDEAVYLFARDGR